MLWVLGRQGFKCSRFVVLNAECVSESRPRLPIRAPLGPRGFLRDCIAQDLTIKKLSFEVA